ncbi:MAG: hypothetical protein DELT_02622 [Desulfovibrio sp.]
MKIKFTDCEKKLSVDDISAIERQLSVSFPKTFTSLYLEYNGGKPDRNTWVDPSGERDNIEIREFMPMLYAEQFGNDPDFTLDGRTLDEWTRKTLPMNLVQFAIDWDGNYFCLGCTDGQIYYFIRDECDENLSHEQNLDANTKFLSNSFADFINELVVNK